MWTKKWYMVLMLILFFALLAPLSAQNLIPNPGFEQGITQDHEYVAYNGSVVTFSGISDEVFQGDSALKIQIDVVGTGGPQVIGIRHQIAGLNSAKAHVARVAVKGPVGQRFRFRIFGDVKQTKNFTVTGADYNVYEYEIDPLEPSGDQSHLVALEFAFPDNGPGTWLVDSLVLEEIDGGDPGGGSGTLPRAYMAPWGSDTNPGSYGQPLKTLSKAVAMLAGDTIYLLEGNYSEEVVLSDFSGIEGAEKVITAYPGEEVIFDGTTAIESPWEVHEGNIFKTTLDHDIWQLFVNGEMMNLCRWPNVEGFIEDQQPVQVDPLPGSLWDQAGTWGHSSTSSSNGIMIDDGARNLAGSGLDMTDAIAILNVGSFKTSAAPVTYHQAGAGEFTWDPSFTDPYLTWQKPDHAYYFLEGKLNLLDRPGEWYFDQSTKMLYMFTKDGAHPDSLEIRGRVQSYAIILDGCHHLTLRDIDFTATTVSGVDCSHLTIENCTFSYPSCARRILGDYSPTDITMFEGNCHHIRMINNIFQYTEGEAFYLNGTDHLMENNLLRHIDFTCANLYMLGGTVDFKGESNVFRNNTIYVAGASESITPGNNNVVEGNEVWGIGHLQNDGSMIQYMVGPAVGSVTRYNWLHDCKKSGMRYDGSLDIGNTGLPGVWDPWGTQTKGMVYGNVIWNCPTGLMIKGDYHVIVNNTVFHNEKVGIVMMNPPPNGANSHSICRNNLSGMISGYRGGMNPDDYPIPGDHSHNWNGYYQDEEIQDMLNDIVNRDFRPVSFDLLIDKGSTEVYSEDLFPAHAFRDSVYDIGAYEYGDTVYPIPGRRETICSHPIPADGGTSNSQDLILAWRPAYKASSCRIYSGSSHSSVAQATPESPEFRGEQVSNMLTPGPLAKGDKLYWRVDALIGDRVVIGDVWYFTANEYANGAVEDTVSIESSVPDEMSFSVYPNPAGEQLHISAMEDLEYLEIIDLQGRIIDMHKGLFRQISVDLSHLADGVYFLRAYYGTELRGWKKIMVHK